MQRVIIHAWFPLLAAEGVRRAAAGASELPSDLSPNAPLVLTSAYHGADLVDSVCRLAARQGLHPGMRLADARALRPALVSCDSDDAAAASRRRRAVAANCARASGLTTRIIRE